jgi:hypothetical protein
MTTDDIANTLGDADWFVEKGTNICTAKVLIAELAEALRVTLAQRDEWRQRASERRVMHRDLLARAQQAEVQRDEARARGAALEAFVSCPHGIPGRDCDCGVSPPTTPNPTDDFDRATDAAGAYLSDLDRRLGMSPTTPNPTENTDA